ncbi:proteasome assembly chaperone family protein [Halostella litorea]|uniref:proteasome assembly chaperone family protein n=1 Tax=Halostella litorea TaxID=2528831 RepID=UPI00109195C5|nr:PAC2 family protein [Halostella litorea]
MVRDSDSAFRVAEPSSPSSTVVAGFSTFGLAGLTAVDYLADHLDLEARGHVTAEGVPTITPFEAGRPRHPTRFLSRDGVDATLLLSEQFVPLPLADELGRTLLDWMAGAGVEEVTVLAGVPVAHGPDDHRTFYVATDDYREHRLAESDVPPMGNGFLDGVNAALLERGMESDLRVGVLVTPVHAQAPDAEAALRLLETLGALYPIDFDTGPLREFADGLQQYYTELSERLDRSEPADRPEDRMYM